MSKPYWTGALLSHWPGSKVSVDEDLGTTLPLEIVAEELVTPVIPGRGWFLKGLVRGSQGPECP